MRLRKQSFRASYPDAAHILGIKCAFHGELPPSVSLNETETRENELSKSGNLVRGGKNASPG